jgi:pyruvate dehydrogenase E2 component (dihydrolipoamide acetyltransferase)
MTEIAMPRLSDTMEEGTILRWLKADGEQVTRGEELVEIETDKATMTYESDQSGTLTLIAAEGDTLAVGEPIAHVGEAGEAPVATTEQAQSTDDEPAPEGPVGESTGGNDRAPKAQPGRGASARDEGERVKASPLAKRIAHEDGVDLQGLTGSGPGGRIVKADVLAAEQAGTNSGDQATAPLEEGTRETPDEQSAASPPIATAKGETTEVELTRTQQTIARRMAESKATIPDFSLQLDVDMEQCVSLRSELKSLAHHEPGDAEGTPTYNDMVVKACALALREHPRANSGYRDGRLQLHSRINVGVAVAADEALVVPTVFDAEEKSLGEIARETRALAARVRDGSITPPELGGGTFTVSNLGMFGVRSFSAIINPPQAAIMSVGSVEQRPVVLDGAIVARHTMSLTLVSDHRVLYGAEAARFLARVRELLQTPSALTL